VACWRVLRPDDRLRRSRPGAKLQARAKPTARCRSGYYTGATVLGKRRSAGWATERWERPCCFLATLSYLLLGPRASSPCASRSRARTGRTRRSPGTLPLGSHYGVARPRAAWLDDSHRVAHVGTSVVPGCLVPHCQRHATLGAPGFGAAHGRPVGSALSVASPSRAPVETPAHRRPLVFLLAAATPGRSPWGDPVDRRLVPVVTTRAVSGPGHVAS